MGKSKILLTKIYYLPIHSLKSTIQAVSFKEERKNRVSYTFVQCHTTGV